MYMRLIDGEWMTGSSTLLRSVGAATGIAIEPGYPAASVTDVNRPAAAAEAAFDIFRELTPDARAAFLEAAADGLVTLAIR